MERDLCKVGMSVFFLTDIWYLGCRSNLMGAIGFDRAAVAGEYQQATHTESQLIAQVRKP